MTATKIESGIYFLHPEGSAWIAAEFRNGCLADVAYESDAASHKAAGDNWSGIAPSGRDRNIGREQAEAIVREVMGDDVCVEMVGVTLAAE